MRLRISEKVVGLKLDKFGGGMIGKRKGSGESDGENLERNSAHRRIVEVLRFPVTRYYYSYFRHSTFRLISD